MAMASQTPIKNNNKRHLEDSTPEKTHNPEKKFDDKPSPKQGENCQDKDNAPTTGDTRTIVSPVSHHDNKREGDYGSDKSPASDNPISTQEKSYAEATAGSSSPDKTHTTTKANLRPHMTSLGQIKNCPSRHSKPETKTTHQSTSKDKNATGKETEAETAKKQIVFIINKNGPVSPQNLKENQILEILGKTLFKKEEMESIRINTKGKRVTVLVNPETEKTRTTLEEIKKIGKTLTTNINNQIKWELTSSPIRAIGVIKGLQTEDTEEKIREELEKTPNIISARKLGKYKTVWSLSFKTNDLPTTLKTKYGNKKLTPFANQTTTCPRCMQSGHRAADCTKNAITCAKCGKEGHPIKSCKAQTPQCPKCKGKHTGFDPKCPQNLRENEEKNKKIQELKEKRERKIEENRQKAAIKQIASQTQQKVPEPQQINTEEIAEKVIEKLEKVISRVIDQKVTKLKEELLKNQEKHLKEIMDKTTDHLTETREITTTLKEYLNYCKENDKESQRKYDEMGRELMEKTIQLTNSSLEEENSMYSETQSTEQSESESESESETSQDEITDNNTENTFTKDSTASNTSQTQTFHTHNNEIINLRPFKQYATPQKNE